MKNIIAIKPVVNVRRGPNQIAGIIGTLKVGDQLEMVGNLIAGPGAGETWAQVKWPKDVSVTAYICVTLSNGGKMCGVVDIETASDEGYQKGWNDCLDEIHTLLVRMRK
jgi:hypothetical protein